MSRHKRAKTKCFVTAPWMLAVPLEHWLLDVSLGWCADWCCNSFTCFVNVEKLGICWIKPQTAKCCWIAQRQRVIAVVTTDFQTAAILLQDSLIVCLPASLKILGRTDFSYRLGGGHLGLEAYSVSILPQQHPYSISTGTLLVCVLCTWDTVEGTTLYITPANSSFGFVCLFDQR